MDGQLVDARFQTIGHIERIDRTAYQFSRICMTIDADCGIGAHTFQLKEVAATCLFLTFDGFGIVGIAVQIAMAQLSVAVIVIEIVGQIDFYSLLLALTRQACLPPFVEVGHLAATFLLGFWKVDRRPSHRPTGSHSNATLLVVVDSTVEMIDYTIMFHHITLMRKQVVVGL